MYSDRLRRIALALAIGGLLFLAYFLTTSGAFTSDDGRIILDTTDSLVNHGNLRLNQTAHFTLLQTSSVEPAQPLLAAPLYWLATQIPWVGNDPMLWLSK